MPPFIGGQIGEVNHGSVGQSVVSAFDPSTLPFVQRIDISVASSISTDTGGIDAVTDLTLNGNDFAQTDSAARPDLSGDAAVFNGTTDHFDMTGISGWEYLVVCYTADTSDTTQSFGSTNLGTGAMFGLLQSGNGSTEIFRAFTVPKWWVDGVEFTGSTRGDAYTATVTDTVKIAIFRVTVGNNGLNTVFGAGSGFLLKGDQHFWGFLDNTVTLDQMNALGNDLASRFGGSFTDMTSIT